MVEMRAEYAAEPQSSRGIVDGAARRPSGGRRARFGGWGRAARSALVTKREGL